MQTLKSYLLQPNILSEKEVDSFMKLWTINKKFKRFEPLLSPGQREKNLYFIVEGTFRSYYSLSVEYTESFGLPNTFYNNYQAFLTDTPSKIYIQALSKAEVFGITRAAFYSFLNKNRAFETFIRVLTEQLLLEIMEKDYLVKLPAAERVQQFLVLRPQIFQLIPHKYIASYLLMTPETLSRVLNKDKS